MRTLEFNFSLSISQINQHLILICSLHNNTPSTIFLTNFFPTKKKLKIPQTLELAFDIWISSIKSSKKINGIVIALHYEFELPLRTSIEWKYIIADANTLVKSRLYRSTVKHWLTNWRFIHAVEAMNCIRTQSYTEYTRVNRRRDEESQQNKTHTHTSPKQHGLFSFLHESETENES